MTPVAWKWRRHDVENWICVGFWNPHEEKAAYEMEGQGWEVVRLYAESNEVAIEREACAKLCEEMHEEDRPSDYAWAIRARGKP